MALGTGVWQTEGSHTAHFSPVPELRYRFHPLYKADFEVIGSIGGKRDLVFIRMPNNSTRGIPGWMFDLERCSAMRFEQTPAVDPHALLALISLLDLHSQDEAHQEDESKSK